MLNGQFDSKQTQDCKVHLHECFELGPYTWGRSSADSHRCFRSGYLLGIYAGSRVSLVCEGLLILLKPSLRGWQRLTHSYQFTNLQECKLSCTSKQRAVLFNNRRVVWILLLWMPLLCVSSTQAIWVDLDLVEVRVLGWVDVTNWVTSFREVTLHIWTDNQLTK